VTGTFKANNPYNNFLLFVYAMLLKFPIFLHPVTPKPQPSDGILYRSFLEWMTINVGNTPVLFSFLTFGLLVIQAIGFNKMVNDQRMMAKPNYLTGMSYLLITSLFSEWFVLSAALIINTILIWVWAKLCTLHNNPSPKTTIYNIGLVISFAAFFYLPALLFILLFIIGLAITRPFRLNEWLIGLVGVVTTFYFFAAWLFISEKWKTYTLPSISFSYPHFLQGRWAIITFIVLIFTMLIGIFFIQNNMRRQIVQTRKSWQLIYIYALVAAYIPFLNATHSFNNWILLAVPVSLIVASAFFYPERKWFPLLMHWGMVAITVAIGYFVR
jgi:hypothetical protein